MNRVVVSVVVPTFKRPELIARCLEAICDQDLERDQFEVIVADDAAEQPGAESTKRRVESFGRTGLRVVYVPVRGRHGPAAARNAGWKAARGEFIAFTDDDTIPDPHWLKSGVTAFQSRAGQAGGGRFRGMILAVSGRTIVPLPKRPTDYELNESGLGRAEFITANCFVLRSALEAIGGFDESFTMAWREDSDLHFRLLHLGGGPEGGAEAIVREENAIVIHPVRPAPFGVALKQAKKAAFNALLYKKHPRLYRERIQRYPPLRYYAMVFCLSSASVAWSMRSRHVAAVALLAWTALVLGFTLKRLRRTTWHPRHVTEMVFTSILLAPLAIYWRLYGAWKYRVAFF